MSIRVRITYSGYATHHHLAVLSRWSRVTVIDEDGTEYCELTRVGWCIQPAWREGLGTHYGPILARFSKKAEAVVAKRAMLAANPHAAWQATLDHVQPIPFELLRKAREAERTARLA